MIALVVAGQALLAQQASIVHLRTVQVVRDGAVTVVTLEADGPLPQPTSGEAYDPPRFFLDFRDVVPESRGAGPTGNPVLQRVRVALYSADPPVTRVVLDLRGEQIVRVDAEPRGTGRVRLLIGVPLDQPPPTPALIPVPPLPSPPRAQGATPPSPVQSATPPPPVRSAPPLPPVQSAPQPPPVQSAPQSPPVPTATPTPLVQTPPPPVQTAPAQAPPVSNVPPPVQKVPAAPPPVRSEPPRRPPETTPATPRPVDTPPSSARPAPPPADPVRLPAPGINPLPPVPGSPTSKGNEGNADRYKAQVEAPLNRLRALRPLLASIDLVKAEPPAGLAASVEELDQTYEALKALRPPQQRAATHDMLLRSCSLAQTAVKLRRNGSDAPTLRNASSAAAGALLLLDRVCIELGCRALAGAR